MLARPYAADPKKGPSTVSTVKIPTEVSERLGWVATLTGKAKQEILTEALKDYFHKVLKEG
jgi:predicted DNA-binding protein